MINNPAEIFDQIKKMNKLIDEANIESENKKNEKKFLIDMITNIKSRIKHIKENPNTEDKKNENFEIK